MCSSDLPPGPLGHADYFATWLVTVFFAGLTLNPMEESRAARITVRAGTGLVVFAVLLSGTRSALLGVLTGTAVYMMFWRPRVTRQTVLMVAAAAISVVLFFISPAGALLRARVVEDVALRGDEHDRVADCAERPPEQQVEQVVRERGGGEAGRADDRADQHRLAAQIGRAHV